MAFVNPQIEQSASLGGNFQLGHRFECVQQRAFNPIIDRVGRLNRQVRRSRFLVLGIRFQRHSGSAHLIEGVIGDNQQGQRCRRGRGFVKDANLLDAKPVECRDQSRLEIDVQNLLFSFF